MNIEELNLISDSDWTKFPPRLFHQPIFYPVTNVEYARQITQEWNLPSYGNGFVVSFDMDADYLKQFKEEKVGLDHHTELWIPSEDLEEFNGHIIGEIKVLEGYTNNENSCYFFSEHIFELTNRGHRVAGYFLDQDFKIDSSKFQTLGGVKLKKELNLINAKDDAGNQRLNIVALSLKTSEDANALSNSTVYELKVSH